MLDAHPNTGILKKRKLIRVLGVLCYAFHGMDDMSEKLDETPIWRNHTGTDSARTRA